MARCYVASPLGFHAAGRHWYAAVLLPALRDVVEIVDPWTAGTPGEIEAARAAGRLRELWLDVGRRNLRLIDGADLLAAVLDGQEVDSGTALEVGYAAARGLPCAGLRTDVRQSGEEGMAVNLQVEATILASGGTIAADVEGLRAELARLATR
jgi:nucleoside 2-deoxyribosyltransferase